MSVHGHLQDASGVSARTPRMHTRTRHQSRDWPLQIAGEHGNSCHAEGGRNRSSCCKRVISRLNGIASAQVCCVPPTWAASMPLMSKVGISAASNLLMTSDTSLLSFTPADHKMLAREPAEYLGTRQHGPTHLAPVHDSGHSMPATRASDSAGKDTKLRNRHV